MPNTLHQGFVWVFRDDQSLAFDLVRSVFGIELPPLAEFYDRKGELDRFAPCVGDTGELRPDLALSALHADPDVERDGAGMILEVQDRVVDLKRWRIWLYWALLAEHLQLSTIVMLVPLTDAVSRWARGLGAREFPPRDGLLVLDRQNMPRVIDLEQARQRPAMVVLSALIHGPRGDRGVLHAAFQVARELPDDRRWRYMTAILCAAPENEEAELRGMMTMDEQIELTETELKSAAYAWGKRDGLTEGERKGKLEALTQLVLTILELRRIPVDASTQARIHACGDPQLLERWAARAKTADDSAELFR